MNREDIIRKIRAHKKNLEKFGVKRIGIFGSFSRGEGYDQSDIDFVIEFEKGSGSFKNFASVVEYLERLFNRPVDILTPAGIESIRILEIKESIKQQVIYV